MGEAGSREAEQFCSSSETSHEFENPQLGRAVRQSLEGSKREDFERKFGSRDPVKGDSTRTETPSSHAQEKRTQENKTGQGKQRQQRKTLAEQRRKHVATITVSAARRRGTQQLKTVDQERQLTSSYLTSEDSVKRDVTRIRIHRRFRTGRKDRRNTTYVREEAHYASNAAASGGLTSEQVDRQSFESGCGFNFAQAGPGTSHAPASWYFSETTRDDVTDSKQTYEPVDSGSADDVILTSPYGSHLFSGPAILESANNKSEFAYNNVTTENLQDTSTAWPLDVLWRRKGDSSQSDVFSSDFNKSSERTSAPNRETEPTSSSTTAGVVCFVPGRRKLRCGLGDQSVERHADVRPIEDLRAKETAENGGLEAGSLDVHALKKARQSLICEPGEGTTSTVLSDVRLAFSLSSSPEPGQTSATVTGSASECMASESEMSGFSGSSVNDFLPSDSEVGPRVTFSSPKLDTRQQVNQEQRDLNQPTDLSAIEIRRRYSVYDYQPSSPFAKYRRRSSILSEGAAPLFLQIQHKRTGPARQLSIDIGEEWEVVHSPVLHSPSTHGGCERNTADDVFSGSCRSAGDSLPVTGRRASGVSIMSRKHLIRRTSHQTSAKLRLMFPGPVASKPTATARPESPAGIAPCTRSAEFRPEGQHAPDQLAALQQTSVKHWVQTEETRESRSRHPQQTATPAVTTIQPVKAAGEGCNAQSAGIEYVAIMMDGSTDMTPDPTSHKRHLLPNPYNRFNQRCHSTIHCPCFFFFCLLCCLPAVYYMGLSDQQFDSGSHDKARRFGRKATVLYSLGATLGVSLFVTCVLCTDLFVPGMFVGPSS